MNHEPPTASSSSAVPHHDTPDHVAYTPTPPTATEIAERRKKNRELFNRKRGDLLEDLLRNIDLLVYVELMVGYYMDTSFPLLLLRTLSQFLLLTPKPPSFPQTPRTQPIASAILLTFLICTTYHLYFPSPSGTEETRGYLHGGIVMDFVGQQGDCSRWRLVSLDVLVGVLQVLGLGGQMVLRGLREGGDKVKTGDQSGGPMVEARVQQDADAEERGVSALEERHAIELRTLDPPGSAASTTRINASAATDDDNDIPGDTESDGLLTHFNSDTDPQSSTHISDTFNSGQILLADLDLWRKFREQISITRFVPEAADSSSSLTVSSTSRTLREELSSRLRRMGLRTEALRRRL